MKQTRTRVAAGAAALFAVNAFVCWKLFGIEYLKHLGSIEAAYIALARYAMENWGDLTWFPLWYAGIPHQNTYPPLLHALVAVFAQAARISPAHSFHAVNAFLYCAGPVALYGMALRISRNAAYGFAAGLFYSLLAPAAWLIPNVRADLGGVWNPRRLHTLVFYGDGPFVSALAFVPLAILCLDLALRRRRPLLYLLAAAAMAAVVLTNWLGASTLAMTVLAYLLANAGEWRDLWPRAAGTVLLAYLLASPWIPPSTLDAIRTNAQTIGGYYQMTGKHLIYAAILATAAWLLGRAFRRLGVPVHARLALYFLVFTGAVTLAAEWADVYLLPQPHRYHLAMEMAFALVAALAVQWVLRRAAAAAVAAMAVLAVALAWHCRGFADRLIEPVDIRRTTEYRTAMWFERNMKDRRVMVPGSTSYFFNIFTDTPQLGGGFDQGVVNWHNRVAVYTIYTGQNAGDRDAEISLLWLKAFGVRALAVGGPNSGEHYKPFANPRKFDGVLPLLHRDGDDFIYAIPGGTGSLAHVVRPSDLVRRPPAHGLDADELRRYVAALENSMLPAAQFEWTSRHAARIESDMEHGQVLSVQVTYHPGWRAEVKGRRVPVRGDGIGLTVIEPGCDGRCVVDLVYDGGVEMKAAKAFSAASLAGCLAWAFLRRRKCSV